MIGNDLQEGTSNRKGELHTRKKLLTVNNLVDFFKRASTLPCESHILKVAGVALWSIKRFRFTKESSYKMNVFFWCGRIVFLVLVAIGSTHPVVGNEEGIANVVEIEADGSIGDTTEQTPLESTTMKPRRRMDILQGVELLGSTTWFRDLRHGGSKGSRSGKGSKKKKSFSFSMSMSMSMPTNEPTQAPSLSNDPSSKPSAEPSISSQPSSAPTGPPTLSSQPSSQPTDQPTVSSQPSSTPTDQPTVSVQPSTTPTAEPTLSVQPSLEPSPQPSLSSEPSLEPSRDLSNFVCPGKCDDEGNPTLSATCTGVPLQPSICEPANGSCDCNAGQAINNADGCNGDDGCACNGIDPVDLMSVNPDAFIEFGSCLQGNDICIFNFGSITNNSCAGGSACQCNFDTIAGASCGSPGACFTNQGNIDGASCSDSNSCAFNSGNIDNQSCTGPGACEKNAGNIDGASCISSNSCANNFGTIQGGSCSGPGACEDNTGIIEQGSCNGPNACPNNSGTITNGQCNNGEPECSSNTGLIDGL